MGFVALVMFLSLLCYWYWSPASLAVMHSFLVVALLAEGVRLVFVSLVHKRVFG